MARALPQLVANAACPLQVGFVRDDHVLGIQAIAAGRSPERVEPLIGLVHLFALRLAEPHLAGHFARHGAPGGLVERPGELLDDGLSRLASATQGRNGGPERMLDEVLDTLVPEGAASDDIALLALHCPVLSERLRLELPGDPAELAAMRSLLRRWLRHADGTPQDVAEILTATGEAAANAIEHAGAPARSSLEIVGTVAGREVDITVRDYGSWRPERADERGRGLVLMRALMDTVEVTPSPEGTTVRLRRRLSGDGSG